MDFDDEDFDKASQVNSNTQLYKEAGNSLVTVVMAAIISQLNIEGVKPWNERTEEERSELFGKINRNREEDSDGNR